MSESDSGDSLEDEVAHFFRIEFFLFSARSFESLKDSLVSDRYLISFVCDEARTCSRFPMFE